MDDLSLEHVKDKIGPEAKKLLLTQKQDLEAKKRGQSRLKVGNRVVYKDALLSKHKGTVRYIGPVKGKEDLSKEFYGIELDSPNGKNDGSVGSVRYFTAKPNHGVFTLRDTLTKLQKKKPSKPN